MSLLTLIIILVIVGALLGARTLGGMVRTGCFFILIVLAAAGFLIYYLVQHH